MGKWAKYTIYDGAGRPIVSFKGLKVKKVKPAGSNQMGFRPLADAVSDKTIDFEVQCDCEDGHEEHIE